MGALTLMLGSNLIVTAQPQIREDDHFWRKRVVNRVSLIEKINQPLVRHESNYYSGGKYSQTEGMVMALINGLKAGRFLAYDPEAWTTTYNYDELVQRMQKFEQSLAPSSDGWDDAYSDDFSAPAEPSVTEWNVSDQSEWGSPFEEAPVFSEQAPVQNQFPDIAPYEQVFHIVEDYIFDKNTSSFTQRIDFFEIVWVDPGETLPEKVLARFRWEDVKEILDETMWKSRFNDAEARSVKEVFELRIFNAFPIEVGGEPVRTLQEAERRRQEMIEFEHHLWSY